MAVRHVESGETMHPLHGPWREANRLYVEGGALAQRLAARPRGRDPGPVVVFDVGLGGAANALAAVTCHQRLLERGGPVRGLHLVSFEHDPAVLDFVLEHADALGYPCGHEPLLRALAAEGRATGPGGLAWVLRAGEFPERLQHEEARAELVFFDPYSPRANPEMWRVDTLEALRRCQRPHAGMLLLTYSSAFAARAALLLAGFYVGEGPRMGAARRTTAAATRFADLAEPVTPGWLARWGRDRDPWPPGTPPGRQRAVRAALLEHPQWSQFLGREQAPRRFGRPLVPDRPDPEAAAPPGGPRRRRGRKRRR